MSSLLKRIGQASVGALLIGSVAGCAGGGQRGAEVASRLRIASVAESSGQPDVALSVLGSLAASAPDNADVQARYARSLARAGRMEEAASAAAEALRRKPADPVLLLELGRIRLLEGRAAEAEESFRAVLAARPRELGAMVGRGVAQDLLGRHAEAQASYRAALALDPQSLSALNNLGLSMVLAGDPGGAVPVLQRLAVRGDAPARVRNNLSVAQTALGDGGQSFQAVQATAAPRSFDDARPRLAPTAAQHDAMPVSFEPPVGVPGGVVAMEPIPDRPRHVRATAPRAPIERKPAED